MANENEAIEGEIVTTDLTTMTAMIRAEIDSNVATAKQYPRSITGFRKDMIEFCTLSEPIAEACIFALPRGKEQVNGKWVAKFIEGPSVRFAEMLISSFGNCRSGARIVGEEREFVIAEGFFHDLEKNVAVKCEIKRRITNSKGQRYNSDMIAVTGNAASSIARRNAALQGIPKALWQEMYDAAKKTAIGDSKTLVAKRSDMMLYFQKLNVTAETIFEFMGVQGIEDIGLDELAILKGIATAIKEGSVSVDKAFTVESGERNQNSKKIFDHIDGLPKDEAPFEKTDLPAGDDALQAVYKKLTDYAGEKGETPDDLISRFTKGKVAALIDLEGKSTNYLNDIALMVDTERNSK